jgi:hypothetical protein
MDARHRYMATIVEDSFGCSAGMVDAVIGDQMGTHASSRRATLAAAAVACSGGGAAGWRSSGGLNARVVCGVRVCACGVGVSKPKQAKGPSRHVPMAERCICACVRACVCVCVRACVRVLQSS